MPSPQDDLIALWNGPQSRRTSVTPVPHEFLLTTDSDQPYTAQQLYVGDTIATAGGVRVYQFPYASDLISTLADRSLPAVNTFYTLGTILSWPKTGRFKVWCRLVLDIIATPAIRNEDLRLRALVRHRLSPNPWANFGGGFSSIHEEGGQQFIMTGTVDRLMTILAGNQVQVQVQIVENVGVLPPSLVSAQFLAARSVFGCYEVED
ncbi:MAG: hypothetical protein ACR2QC_01575 [Gammaproteobacteria bacterium]